MINGILALFKRPNHEVYYKQSYKSYHGLCGTKYKYDKSNYVAVEDGFENRMKGNYRILHTTCFWLVTYVLTIPKDATLISKDEYERGIK